MKYLLLQHIHGAGNGQSHLIYITPAKIANGAARLKICHYVLLITQKDRVPQVQICHPSETDGIWWENYHKSWFESIEQTES